jgi:hypothetical protein
MLTLKDDNNDTREVKRTSLHMKGAKDEATLWTDISRQCSVVDDSRDAVTGRELIVSTVDEVMAQVDAVERSCVTSSASFW